jgi:hypothetical protein
VSDYATTGAPRQQPAKKYMRPRHIVSWPLLLFGLIVGVAGGLAYAWGVSPVVEYDTEPWQLSQPNKAHYVVAIMLDYSYDGDLNQAVNRLLGLQLPGDPIQAVADIACNLASTGYVDSNSGLRAVRSMMTFYPLQGKQGCADTLLPGVQETPPPTIGAAEVVIPTATFIPPATKTPTPMGGTGPTSTPIRVVVPTAAPRRNFVLANISTFCSSRESGEIQVLVQDVTGEGVPGQRVRVRWDSGTDQFFTGLKPGEDPGYGDFTMTPGNGYLVDLPNLSEPIAEPLAAVPCTTESGEAATTSYRVIFREG